MYATSKLIIPPKPARNSPYIPKLRIKLKPSLNRNRLVHGASLRSSALVQLSRGDVVLRSAHSTRTPGGALRSSHKVTDKINATGGSCEDECRDDTGKATCGDCEAGVSVTKRAGSKRKQATLEMDNLDLEGSESVLTKVNLKALINRDTFYEFPIETQRMLADLLPYYDRQKQSWPTQPSTNGYVEDGPRAQAKLVATMEDESVWLHPSALSNEFFTKALQDYTDRQARGEFAPRLRNRAGLRANAVGRGRYGTTIVNADLISGKQTLKHTVTVSGSNYDIVRRTTRVKNKTYASLSRQNTSRSRNRVGDSATQSPSSSEKLLRSLPKSVRRTQNLSAVNKLVHGRMKLRKKTTQSIPSSRASLESSPSQTSPDAMQTDTGSSSNVVGRSPDIPSVSMDDIGSVSSTSASLTPKPVKTSPCELNNTVFRNSSVRTSSFSSPQGLDLCDGLDTAYNLNHTQKLDDSLSVPKGVRKMSRLENPHSSPSTTPVPDSKPQNALGSPRPGRNSRGLSSVADSAVPLSMPPPRQTKTLAAMREKMRAKRMLKEAERNPSGSGFYSLPGSMTPHPASGACGYFHQPTGYPSSSNGFGSPLLPSVGCKRSSSALSSPQNPNSASPTNCDKQPYTNPTSVSLCNLLNGNGESLPGKLVPNSPSSPHSLPNAELSSPLLNSSLSNDFLSHISLQDNCTFGQEVSGQSYPSSPLSTNSSSGILASSGNVPGSAYSPQPTKTTVPVVYNEVKQEQSVSAPPTPILPQAGQTMLSFSSLVPASTPSTTLPNPGSTRLSQQGSLLTLPSSTVAPSVPVQQPTLHSQTHSPIRQVQSCASTVSSTSSGNTVVLSVNNPTLVSHSTVTNQLHPPPPPPPPLPPPPLPPPSVLPSVSSSSSLSLLSSSSSVPELRTSHSYPTLSTVASSSPPVSTTCSATSVDATRSQAAVGQAVSLTTQLSASAAVTKFLVGSSQNRPSTTTRAFFVDGDNLSEAVALLQSLNPKATITQQQFLLIPSSNKSQMFLCPTPSTSTPNILSVPVSTSAPSSTTQTNGTSAPLPSATQVSLSAKNSPNQTVVPTANFSGIRQLSVSSLNAMSNQVAANQLVPNATTSVTGLDSAHSLHSKAANVVLPTMGNNPITSSNTQGSRSLICTKSVPSYPQPATPNVVHLKPQTKPVIDHVPDRSLNKATVVVPRRTVAPVSKPLTETVYATPVTQSQIAFSLIAPGSSVLNSETPVMFVSETHPNTYSRQLNLSAVQSSVASLDRSQTLVSSIGTVGPASIAPNAGPAHTAASAQMTVINPAQLTSCDLHLQPQTQQRIHSVPTQLHCASSVAPEQTVQAVRATSISYASNIGPGTTPTYLSAATIVSPCLPAVVLPHTLTVQSQRTNVITSNHSNTNNHCINGTDHTMFRSVP